MTESSDRDEHKPGYWDEPENQITHPRFWSAGVTPLLPAGALTRTARGSLISAVFGSVFAPLYLIVYLIGDLDWTRWATYVHILWPVAIAAYAFRYWRSWRVLRRHGSDQTEIVRQPTP